MAPEEKLFYQQMGLRIAQFRKEQNITQTQLAEILGIAQQTLAHYEVDRLRASVSMLPIMARALSVSIEELIGEQAEDSKGKRGSTPRLEQQLSQIAQLPKMKHKFVMEMLDTVLQQAS